MFKTLKAYQQLKGVTQEYIAKEILGIAASSYNNKLMGRYEFTLSEAKKLADFFGKTVDEIFFKDEVN